MLPLRRYFSAAYPAVAVSTVEEGRLLEYVVEQFPKHEVISIGADKVIRNIRSNGQVTEGARDRAFGDVIDESKKKNGRILVMFDFHRFVQDAANCRRLKAALPTLKALGSPGSMFILCAPTWSMPEELRHDIPIIDMPLPTREMLKSAWDVVNSSMPVKLTAQEESVLLDAAAGLTLEESESVFSFARFTEEDFENIGRPDPQVVLDEKLRLIKASGYLEVRPAIQMSEVGGLGRLKRYVEKRVVPTIHDDELRVRGILLAGVSGCLHGDTPIFDPVDGTTISVRQRWLNARPFSVVALHGTKPTIALAQAPRNYGVEKMIEFTFEDQTAVRVTPRHQFWCGDGYISASLVYERLRLCGAYRLPSISEPDLLASLANGQHSIDRGEDSLVGYQTCHRCGDQQLLSRLSGDQEALPSRADSLGHSRRAYRKGDLGDKCKHSSSESFARHSRTDSCHVLEMRSSDEPISHEPSGLQKLGADSSSLFLLPVVESAQTHRDRRHSAYAQKSSIDREVSLFASTSDAREAIAKREIELNPKLEQPLPGFFPRNTIDSKLQCGPHVRFSSSATPALGSLYVAEYTKPIRVVQAREVESSEYFDFHVPVYNNYWALGCFHHNTGKTLSTMAIAGTLGWPVLCASIPRMKGSRIGESEGNIITALKTAEAFAPCTLLLDEFEKGVAGYASSAQSDAGTMLGMVGILLAWLSDHRRQIITVATCNNYKALPPELTNAHRFDECFFVDVPGASERVEIASVHLKRLGLNAGFSQAVSDLTPDWTGAEIEKLIKDTAAYTKRKLTENALRETASEIKTFGSMRGKEVEDLREWGKSAMRLANTDDALLESMAVAARGKGRIN